MSTKFKIGLNEMEAEYGPLTFSDLLIAHRLGEELTQVEMAKLLKISKQGLNDLEKGRKIPSIRRAVQMARKMGLLEELVVQIILQDQVSKENLNLTVSVRKTGKNAA
jgi:DNA-binding XRE family transcriptional regulator